MRPGFEKLDRRKLTYQFDLEKDVPWDRADAPGLFFTRSYLKKLGFDVDALEGNPEAHDFLQSVLALCTCLTFANLEDDVIVFLQEEHEDVPLTRSATLLMAEEVKHTILFRRFAGILCAQRPGLETALERHYSPPPGFAHLKAGRDKLGKPAVLHYLFWLNTVFFEEFTMFLYKAISQEPDAVQPAWLAVHKCHLREEAQHVLTDRGYIETSPLTDDERYQWSKVFYLNLQSAFQEFFCLDAVEAAMKDEFPEVRLYASSPALESLPLFEDILTGSSFSHTRASAPYLQRYREDWEAKRAAAV